MSGPSTTPFRTDIQGLRAIAVTLVLLYHAGVGLFSGGYVGVDVFFVISGFLITSHLASELSRGGRLAFSSFYARRIRRILPVSMFVLVVSFVASLAVLPILRIESVVREALATALYVPNMLFAARSVDYLADTTPSVYQHYWSLGIEEQFYLAWPVTLALAWWAARRRRPVVVALVGALVLGSFVLCQLVMARSVSLAFFLLPTRAWELGVGALLALVAGRSEAAGGDRRRWWEHPTLTAVGGWVGLAAVAAAGILFTAATRFPGVTALVPVGGTALVIWCGRLAPPRGPGALLSIRPAQQVGLWSYSLYLWHWPLLILGAAALDRRLDVNEGLALVALAFPLSIASYHLVEQPFRTGRRLRDRPWATIAVAGGATAAVVAVVAGLGAVWERRPLHAGPPVAVEAPSAPPRFSAVVPENLMPSLREVEDDLPVTTNRSCHLDQPARRPNPCRLGDAGGATTVVAFGDSHALQWVPALERYATEGGHRLVTHTKSACPSVSVTIVNDGNPYVACDVWREAVLEELRSEPPDLVVISNSRAYLSRTGADGREQWAEGLRATVEALPPGTRVVVLADTPRFDQSPGWCLSAHLGDTGACALPREDALDQAWIDAEAAAARGAGAHPVDLNDHLCTDRCGLVIGPYLVYRDTNHLTATFASALGDALGSGLDEAWAAG